MVEKNKEQHNKRKGNRFEVTKRTYKSAKAESIPNSKGIAPLRSLFKSHLLWRLWLRKTKNTAKEGREREGRARERGPFERERERERERAVRDREGRSREREKEREMLTRKSVMLNSQRSQEVRAQLNYWTPVEKKINMDFWKRGCCFPMSTNQVEFRHVTTNITLHPIPVTNGNRIIHLSTKEKKQSKKKVTPRTK